MKKKSGQFLTKPTILRVLLSISETSGPYNQFCLPFVERHNITLITLGKSKITPPNGIRHIQTKNIVHLICIFVHRVWFCNYDYVHIHHANLSLLGWLAGKKTQIIFTLGTCYENLKTRHKLFLFLSAKRLNRLVCCSGAVRKSISKTPIEWLIHSKITKIDHAINLQRIPDAGGKLNKIVCTSRLEASKNVEMILSSYKSSGSKLPLHIFGEGKERFKLSSEYRDNTISFYGVVPRDEILRVLSNSCYFISASDSDGLPIGVLEAAASKCILILKKSEPHSYLKELGLKFIEFDRITELTAILSNLDASLYANDVSENSRLLEEYFSIERLNDEYMKLVGF